MFGAGLKRSLLSAVVVFGCANVAFGYGGTSNTSGYHDHNHQHPLSDTDLSSTNAIWIIICTFLILTMQSGFGLLESGSVSRKNEVNIMYKNATDLVVGGTVYWLVGYGLAFGEPNGDNGFIGMNNWALTGVPANQSGRTEATFVFQLSFVSTASTIVSGAVAERIKLHSYIFLTVSNTLTYSVVSHWQWAEHGWLNKLRVIDIAGCGAVHVCGGAMAFMSAFMLGPRSGRYELGSAPPIGNGLNIFLGTFFLWWGWLAFSCGSVFGVQESQWANIAKTATSTILGSVGGGSCGMFISAIRWRGRIFVITDLCNGVIGGLVSVSATGTLICPWEAYLTGFIGGMIVLQGAKFLDYLKIDDPIGAVSVHWFGGMWGLLSAILFLHEDPFTQLNKGRKGIFHGGNLEILGIQLVALASISVWALAVTYLAIQILVHTRLGYRVDEKAEKVGADIMEHQIGEIPESEVDLLDKLSAAELFQLEHNRPLFIGPEFTNPEWASHLDVHKPSSFFTRYDSYVWNGEPPGSRGHAETSDRHVKSTNHGHAETPERHVKNTDHATMGSAELENGDTFEKFPHAHRVDSGLPVSGGESSSSEKL